MSTEPVTPTPVVVRVTFTLRDSLIADLRTLAGPLSLDDHLWRWEGASRQALALALRAAGWEPRRMRYPRGQKPRTWWVRSAP